MWLFLGVILTAVGGLLMPWSLSAGLIAWAVAIAALKRNTIAGEEALTTTLALLSFLGAAALFGQYAAQRLL